MTAVERCRALLGAENFQLPKELSATKNHSANQKRENLQKYTDGVITNHISKQNYSLENIYVMIFMLLVRDRRNNSR